MRAVHQIPYRGLILDVVGYSYYEPQGDYITFTIHEVYLGGTDISAMFDSYSELEAITLTEHY